MHRDPPSSTRARRALTIWEGTRPPPSSRRVGVPALLLVGLLLAAPPAGGRAGEFPSPAMLVLSATGRTYPVVFQVLNRSSYVGVPGASVTFGGTFVGTTDGQGLLAAPEPVANGTYDLNVSAPGYLTNDSLVTVEGSSTFQVLLTSTYTGPPAEGTCEGSFFPTGATLWIDQQVVPGSPGPAGGEAFDVACPSGTDHWKLSYGSDTVLGTLLVEPLGVSWAHFAGVNSTAPSPLGTLVDELPFIAAGIVVGVVVAIVAVWTLRRRRKPSPPPQANPRPSEGLSDPTDAAAHGQPAGDPAPEAGARDPGA